MNAAKYVFANAANKSALRAAPCHGRYEWLVAQLRRVIALRQGHQPCGIQRAIHQVQIIFGEPQRFQQRIADVARAIVFDFQTDGVTRNSDFISTGRNAPAQAVRERIAQIAARVDAVRLEIEHDCPRHIRDALLKNVAAHEDDLYLVDGPLNPTRLMTLTQGDHSRSCATSHS